MNNERGVFWQLNLLDPSTQKVTIATFDNAEAARKAATLSVLPSEFKKLYRMDPVHGATEIQF